MKTGEGKCVGSVSYTSWDNYVTKASYTLDDASPPLLWRKTSVGQGKVEVEGEACISLEMALGQLKSYETTFAAQSEGDFAGIAKTLTEAKPADPKVIVAEEKVAEAAAAAEADY